MPDEKAVTNIRSPRDVLADILKLQQQQSKPNWKGIAAGVVAGGVTGALVERNNPGLGAQAGLGVANRLVGAGMEKTAQEKQAQFDALGSELKAGQEVGKNMLDVIRSNPEMLKGMDPQQIEDYVGFHIDPEAYTNAKKETEAAKVRRETNQHFFDEGLKSGNKGLVNEAMRAMLEDKNFEMTPAIQEEMDRSADAGTWERQAKIFQDSVADPVVSAPLLARAQAEGKMPFQMFGYVREGLVKSPEYQKKLADLTKSKEGQDADDILKRYKAYIKASPKEVMGKTPKEVMTLAGISEAEQVMLPAFIQNSLNWDKIQAANFTNAYLLRLSGQKDFMGDPLPSKDINDMTQGALNTRMAAMQQQLEAGGEYMTRLGNRKDEIMRNDPNISDNDAFIQAKTELEGKAK